MGELASVARDRLIARASGHDICADLAVDEARPATGDKLLTGVETR